ncbi:hypothetical protein GGE39_004036 [Rhizobium leguminosarum]|nr:terminase small subunit [Rhizobium leguminosarum]MBA8834085.1 hypothetical protein [Rhizobium leguminosarum]
METSAEWVLVAIAYVAFGDVRDVFDDQGPLKAPSEWDERTAASVVGLEIGTSAKGKGEVVHAAKIKRADRLRALDMLARHPRSITTGYFYNHSRSRNAVSAAADCGRIRPRHRQIGPHGRCPAGMRRLWRRTANTDTQMHQDGRRYRQMGSALRSRAGDLGPRSGKGGVGLAASSTSRAIRLTFRRPAIGAGFRRAHPGGKAR